MHLMCPGVPDVFRCSGAVRNRREWAKWHSHGYGQTYALAYVLTYIQAGHAGFSWILPRAALSYAPSRTFGGNGASYHHHDSPHRAGFPIADRLLPAVGNGPFRMHGHGDRQP
ncbi:hypothetical protein DSM19430T_25830 [Desulfovibrio psychrotolerans]|uniref:Uncharacterized protein n=1 Tax=Desulfovibrio psychrotolerans TaxID=415242 RepID=A0A7J0BW09_9BACT|nr:hypothetical protein DSM19430T_25830 [Desulfovibrio psychrotolerans]